MFFLFWITIIVLASTVTAFISFRVARRSGILVLWVWAVFLILISLLDSAIEHDGMEYFGYFLILYLVLIPVSLVSVVAGLLGWRKYALNNK
jgi:hypothetical protein